MDKRVVIMGAAGKDFHIFNTCYRNDPKVRVVAFTATQIPNIDDRAYPASLAGEGYPDGIPIYPESELPSLIEKEKVTDVIFGYSDVSYKYIEEKKALVKKAGARFSLFDVEATMIPSSKPVIAICATRTGCGKSQTTRSVAEILRQKGRKVVVIRHPMPYGDLAKQSVQRFEKLSDLEKHECTIEEMEEYEPHIDKGIVVYAGVDYGAILREAEKEADVILWDGGNNDTPFYKPNLYITLVDPLRAGHELEFFPGKENFVRADVILFNKMAQADEESVKQIEANIAAHNPNAKIIKANSPVTVADPSLIKGKRVLVVEDGPTLTHGGMTFGAGTIAARAAGAAEMIDPRPFAVGSIKKAYETYSHLDKILPALGYGDTQVKELEETISRCDCEAVVIGTPIDLTRIVRIDKPSVRVTYDLEEVGELKLVDLLQDF